MSIHSDHHAPSERTPAAAFSLRENGNLQSLPHRIVTFHLNGQLYALPLQYVERAVRMVAITPMPDAPAGVFGIINMAGTLVPVLDLRSCLGLQGKAPSINDSLLIARVHGQMMALAVDEVCAVLELSAQRFEMVPGTEHCAGAHSHLVAMAIQEKDNVIFLLDVARLVTTLEGSTLLL